MGEHRLRKNDYYEGNYCRTHTSRVGCFCLTSHDKFIPKVRSHILYYNYFQLGQHWIAADGL